MIERALAMDKLLQSLPLMLALIGGAVYAENEYAKEADINQSLQVIQIERYQDKINFLGYKEIQNTITPDQKWELQYFKDKRDNLLKGKH